MKYATLPTLPVGIDQAIFWPAVLEGLEAQKGRVEKMIDGINQLKAGGKKASTRAEDDATQTKGRRHTKKKRNLSPEARQRIAEAQKKRWAAVRKDAEEAAA